MFFAQRILGMSSSDLLFRQREVYIVGNGADPGGHFRMGLAVRRKEGQQEYTGLGRG
jgi:hypothetical protein